MTRVSNEDLTERIALIVSEHQGYRVATENSRGVAREIVGVAADALLGPVTDEERRQHRNIAGFVPLVVEIFLENRRARLEAPAKTAEERVTLRSDPDTDKNYDVLLDGEPMKIEVPEGMLKAAMSVRTCDRSWSGICALALEAALKWLAKNPIVPTDEQRAQLAREISYEDSGSGIILARAAIQWQRIMFLAPELDAIQKLRQIRYDLAERPEKTSLALVVEGLDDVLAMLEPENKAQL